MSCKYLEEVQHARTFYPYSHVSCYSLPFRVSFKSRSACSFLPDVQTKGFIFRFMSALQSQFQRAYACTGNGAPPSKLGCGLREFRSVCRRDQVQVEFSQSTIDLVSKAGPLSLWCRPCLVQFLDPAPSPEKHETQSRGRMKLRVLDQQMCTSTVCWSTVYESHSRSEVPFQHYFSSA